MGDEAFDGAWKRAARFRKTSRELEPLVFDTWRELQREPLDVPTFTASLTRLLEYLCTPDGRTDANCCTVDHFFDESEPAWRRLPPPLASIMEDLSGTLHDAIYAPHVASTFGSLPEQLLERVRDLGR